jgi:signal transduction histidine kinase
MLLRISLLIFFIFGITNAKAQSVSDLLMKAYFSADSQQIYLKQAQNLVKHDSDIALIYFWKNAKSCDTGNIDTGIYYANKAIPILSKLNKWKVVCNAYNNIGKAYRVAGNYDVAIQYFFKGLSVAEQKKLWRWQVDLLGMISLSYHDWEDYVKGIEFGNKAIAMCKTYADSVDYRKFNLAYNTLAINYDDNGSHEEAIRLHKICVARARNFDDSIIGISSIMNIGNSLRQLKRYKEALPWIYSALDVNERGGVKGSNAQYYDYQKATCYTNLGYIFSGLGDIKKADSAIALAKKHSLASNDAEKLRDYYSLAYEHARKQNRLEEALTAQEQYLQIRDSLYNAKRLATVTEMETKYNVAQKEKSLLIAKAESARRSRLMQIFGLLAIASTIIGFLFFRQQKLRRQQEAQAFELQAAIAQVETQNKLHHQRLSISRDLHDNIGAQLTFIIGAVDNLKYAYRTIDESIIKQLTKIGSFTRETITDLRDTIWAMNNDELSFAEMRSRLTNSMEMAKTNEQTIAFDFTIDQTLDSLKINSLQGINLYRCLQEAVNNAVKHAQATSINVDVTKQENALVATVQDNGKGFDERTAQLSNGLSNMRNRMEEINGSAEINSQLDTGTTITFKFITST